MDISAAVKALKKAADVYGEAKKIPEQKQILEGLAVIAVLQQDKFDLQEEIRTLKTKLRELEEKFKDTNNLVFVDERQSYWILDSEGEPEEGPFCMSCFDVHKRKQRLQKSHEGYYSCPACKNKFLVNKAENEAAHARHVQRMEENRRQQRWQSF